MSGMEEFGRAASLDIPPLEYYQLIKKFNDRIREQVTAELQQNASNLPPFITLVTPGSDGRREKGSSESPIEVIALLDDRTGETLDIDAIKTGIQHVIDGVTSTRMAPSLEIKAPGQEYSLYHNRQGIVQPGRVIDSRKLFGSDEMHADAKGRVSDELIAMRSGDIEKVRSLPRDAFKVVETGMNRIGGREAMHFNIENGLVYYDPKASQLSFKIGPLRLVQNKLLLEAVMHTRREKDRSFMGSMASGIVDRLEQLSDDRMVNLSKDSIFQIMEHYAFFLRLYHRSEEAYSQRREVVMQLTVSEREEVARQLLSLSELMRAIKIERVKR